MGSALACAPLRRRDGASSRTGPPSYPLPMRCPRRSSLRPRIWKPHITSPFGPLTLDQLHRPGHLGALVHRPYFLYGLLASHQADLARLRCSSVTALHEDFRFRVVASLGPERKPGSSKSPSSTLFVAPDIVGRASALAIELARACSSTALRLAAVIPEEPRRAMWGLSPPDVALPRPRGE